MGGWGWTGCHKFKQQLTFRVKVPCGNGPLADTYLYRREGTERREAPSDTRRPFRPFAKRIHAARESTPPRRDCE